jgi:hypothetical protein
LRNDNASVPFACSSLTALCAQSLFEGRPLETVPEYIGACPQCAVKAAQ